MLRVHEYSTVNSCSTQFGRFSPFRYTGIAVQVAVQVGWGLWSKTSCRCFASYPQPTCTATFCCTGLQFQCTTIIFRENDNEPTFAMPKRQRTHHAKPADTVGKFAWSATCSNCVVKLKLWPKTKSNRHRHRKVYYLLTSTPIKHNVINKIKSTRNVSDTTS